MAPAIVAHLWINADLFLELHNRTRDIFEGNRSFRLFRIFLERWNLLVSDHRMLSPWFVQSILVWMWRKIIGRSYRITGLNPVILRVRFDSEPHSCWNGVSRSAQPHFHWIPFIPIIRCKSSAYQFRFHLIHSAASHLLFRADPIVVFIENHSCLR